MTFALLLPAVLSLFILAAHFLRAGWIVGVAICMAALVALSIPRRWSMRAVQILLILGTLEWLRVTYFFVGIRAANGLAWTRLAVILGFVAGFTALSAILFETRRVRRRYLAARNLALRQ
jgi:hypothetical protein